ncbi:diacylglycerol kinase catalytic region [Leadbetterella byssophila DSM 17132]|uniref:Diacylglycerol kinase catalytic region n=1 Tax=Leadbetterella byssophila (strain DSM 17132 / JCM 16389 / KACC 11308 / NBRC 106382 / 4M15) TaxID=649349 RepID=E4RYH7_LEAB4|nr:diacylglycerol kinase family protein [Leadbetterella byssophila]ADQ19107.1 diacylglycerol kinase catalytic region [Leadbetterella byssophila DSM 17132]
MNKPTLIFIINPSAGKGKSLSKDLVLSHWPNHQVIFEEAYDGRAERILNYLEQGITEFVVAGGDGTVNDIAKLLVHTNASMGIIPLGSGNGLARDLGLPTEPLEALSVVSNGTVRAIDVGYLNGKPFFCTAGVGFDALCAHDFAKKKHSRGLWNYIKIIFERYFSYTGIEARYQNGIKRYFSITFANAGQFGNNAYIAPHARVDDGLLDCAMILPHPKWRFADLGIRLISKRLNGFPYFEHLNFKDLKLEDLSDLHAHIDGEAVDLEGPTVHVKIEEKALKVII